MTGDVELDLSFAPTPANDNFAHRQKLTGTKLTLHADNWGATREIGEPDHSDTPGGASLWWSWIAPAAGELTLTPTSATGASLLLGVYTGTALTNLVPVPTQYEYPESVVMTVEKGGSYQIAVDSPVDPLQPGPFELDLEFVSEPHNDRFVNRTSIFGTSITWTNSIAFATVESGTPVDNGGWMPTLWWSWTSPVSGYVTINCSSDQFIDVFTGSTLANLTPIVSGAPVSFESVAGTTYAIAASGVAKRWKCTLACPPCGSSSQSMGRAFSKAITLP